jgi:hypothetical protein
VSAVNSSDDGYSLGHANATLTPVRQFGLSSYLLFAQNSVARGGLVERKELLSGVYMAKCLVKVTDGNILTGILNKREEKIEMAKPLVTVLEIKEENPVMINTVDMEEGGKSSGEGVSDKLRTDHLNTEEKKSLHEMF